MAVCLSRSADAIVALLAVLKAGGAYLPLDPNDPKRRIAELLSDSAAPVVVTTTGWAAEFDGHRPLVLVNEDDGADGADGDASHSALPLGDPDQLAYVLYTSGSTGTPKGVAVSHRAVLRLVSDQAYATFSADRRFLAAAHLAFDASTLEIWGPLVHGGAVVVLDARVPMAEDIRAAVTDHGVTTAWLTASLFNLIVDEDASALASLDELLIGGEALSVPHVRAAMEAAPGLQIVNGYGPTECTTFTCCHRLDSRQPPVEAIPIGRPIAHTTTRILNDSLARVAVGEAGELYVGGPGVARGYLNRPALTAERFIPDPFSTEPGARLYRTGDAVRWRPEGVIDFLGRSDQQVKVRGFRIELGEVEAALRTHPDVRDAVAAVRADDERGPRLVAYVVGDDGISSEALRGHARDRLPGHMVPQELLIAETLPLTATGKVDRAAVQLGEVQLREAVSPTVLHSTVARIWSDVLHCPDVQPDDEFLHLGGDSLLAAQVVARLRDALGVDVPYREIFERRTVAGLADALEARLSGTEQPASPEERVPASSAQRRLWYLQQLAPSVPHYNAPACFRLRGPLDCAAMQAAVTEVVRRHEALRTTFELEDGVLWQRIHSEPRIDFEVHDLSGADEDGREAQALDWIAKLVAAPFDLTAGPLVRAGLACLGEADHILVVVFHHTVYDGLSARPLTAELGVFYRALTLGEPLTLPPLPAQYKDYSAEDDAGSPSERDRLRYWRSQLEGADLVMDLPTDRPRPRVRSYGADEVAFMIGPEAVRRVREVCRERKATLFMGLLAAFEVVLSRWLGKDDFVLGTVMGGRRRTEFEPLIGFFVNTVALRSDVPQAADFGQQVEQVCRRMLDAHEHEVRFDRLVEELEPDRDPSRDPMVQVVFQQFDTPGPQSLDEELELVQFDVPNAAAKFELLVVVSETPDGLLGRIEYATDLFDRPTLERMARHFTTFVERVVADTHAPLSAISMLSGEERAQLVRWSGPETPVAAGRCIHELVEAHVATAPQAEAVVDGALRLTYAELDARADDLARRLRSLGVGPETRVGVSLPRSADGIIALLAVLKAGGAYVPLDPAYPAPRLRFMVEDAGMTVVISRTDCNGSLALGPDVQRVLVDDVADDVRPTAPLPAVDPDNAAYVIYTSGSTGTPKGVVVSHASVVSLFAATAPFYEFGPSDAWSLFFSLSFDFSVWEAWGALCHGGRLVVVPSETAPSPPDLLRLLVDECVTMLSQTPSAFAGLAREMRRADAATVAGLRLRHVVFGGEPLRLPHLADWHAIHPGPAARLVNMYGITETTVHVTLSPLPAHPEPHDPSVGKPIPHLAVRIVDRHLEPVPVGVPGELLVGGPGVARGYLNRPRLTAERFVPDPDAAQPGQRLYRSGDIGRWAPDGTIDYLNRADSQVKVRGYRIELGEVEAVLASHPDVLDAAAAVRDDGGPARLVAYFVPRPGVDSDRTAWTTELRAHFAAHVPEHMTPQAFVPLDALPTTPSGKVDRQALPPPTAPRLVDAVEREAPSGDVEEAIAAIWREVLQVDDVSRTDDFFALGGTSLLAAQVMARLRDVLGAELGLSDFLRHPVVAELPPLLEQGGVDPAVIPIRPRLTGLPCSHAQERLWFFDRLTPDTAVYNVPVAVRLSGPLSLPKLRQALAQLVHRHEALRTTFAFEDDQLCQVVSGGGFDFSVVDLRRLPSDVADAEAIAVVEEAAAEPFDLAHGPLLRVVVVRMAEDEHVVLVVMHHAITDGWSFSVFWRDLSALYQDASLPTLAVQYADVAAWQREHEDSATIQAGLEYWRRELSGLDLVLELPTDRPRPEVQSHRGGHVRFQLPADLHAGLEGLARDEGTTPFTVLLATFHLLLHSLSGSQDVCVGIPALHRPRRDLEHVIGPFLNMLVARASFPESMTFRGLVRQLGQRLLDAYTHAELPFERLVQALHPARDTSRSPVVQAFFSVVPDLGAGIALPDVEAASVPVLTPTSKVDLSLSVEEGTAAVECILEYAVDLFDEATVQGMADTYVRLVAAAVVDPDAPLSPGSRPEPQPSGEGLRLCVLPNGLALYHTDGDAALSQYREFWEEDRWLPKEVEIAPGARVVTVGPGSGAFAVRVAERATGVTVLAVDIDEADMLGIERTASLYEFDLWVARGSESLSSLLRARGVETVDLLRIDGSSACLEGIHEQDWRRINQVVARVDSPQGLTALLEGHGFQVHSADGFVYATRLVAPRVTAPVRQLGTERLLTQLWRDVLKVERVRPDDNFFDLGGSSLLLVRVLIGLRRSLDDPPTLVDLFRYPTVRLLAAHIDRGRR